MNRMIVLAAVLTASGSALALDISDDDLKKKGFAGEVEFGLTESRGNTEESSIRGKTEIDYFVEQWRHHTQLEAKYIKDDVKTKDKRVFGSYQADRKWSEKNYAFGLVEYEHDRIRGFEDQVSLALGYGHSFVPHTSATLKTEIGPGYRWNQAGEGTKEFILRGALNYNWKMTDTSKLTEKFTVDSGGDNTISRSETAITTTVIGALAMKLSLTLTHKTHPGMDGAVKKEKLDSITGVTLLYGF